ncbi:tetratricopeptide repeat protein [Streptomyces sp. NPDC029216]|uniref:tetratricopeptide repeat protein n=1 Tax=Streptomyces sp. NPDC029216 TaxID=3154701 RepID=UPI0033E2A430
MTFSGEGGSLPEDVHQEVRAVGGFAYGVVGADIHVFGDGSPLYLLLRHLKATAQRSDWLRAQPSRMLDARLEVVDFTSREGELADLIDWRDSPARLAVRWLHGAGGQGKTRLAARFAAECEETGWLVVHAVHGTDTHPPAEGSQDMRVRGHRGVLLLVDYADRWPMGHLNWLFRNGLLRQSVSVRVLLLARSVQGWSALRGALNRLRLGVETTDQPLAPLPGEPGTRDRMFRAARACFARHYPDRAPGDVACPVDLAHPDFGLTLSVHMAALVAVDALASGRTPPTDMLGLTGYLLDREHENWRQLHENRAHGLDFRTSDRILGRVVFTAVLTGPLRSERAEKLLGALMFERPGQALSDHAVCYPPALPGRTNVLEPLLPDRLAEDFLALSLPGSPVTGYATDLWSVTAAHTVVEKRFGRPVPWTGRALAFLAAATERWPHVGERVLYPLLLREPELAEAGGSAVLSSLAAIENVDPEVLTNVYGPLRNTQAAGVAVGVGDLGGRVVADQLEATTDEAARAALLVELGERYGAAGRWEDATAAAEEAVALFRRLAREGPEYRRDLMAALAQFGVHVANSGRHAGARAVLEEALALCRSMAPAEPGRATFLPHLLYVMAKTLAAIGDIDQALSLTEEAIALHNDLRDTDLSAFWANYPSHLRLLTAHGEFLVRVGRQEEAVESSEAAVDGARSAFFLYPGSAPQVLANALFTLGRVRREAGRTASAVEPTTEAVDLYRQLARAHPDYYQRNLKEAVATLTVMLAETGRHAEARASAEEAIALYQQSSSPNDEAVASRVAAMYLLRHSEGPQERLPWGTEREIDEVGERLAGAGQWPQLWDLVCKVPVLDAIRLVRRFSDEHWQPPESAGQTLMRRLASVDLRTADTLAEACAPAGAQQVPCVLTSARLVSFAFGRPRMAFTASEEGGLRLELLDLDTGRRHPLYRGGADHEAVVCVADDILAVRHADRGSGAPVDLVRYTSGAEEVIASGNALRGAAGAATSDGFLIGLVRDPTVMVGTRGDLYAVDLLPMGLPRGNCLAVDPTGTRAAFAHGNRLIVADTLLGSVLARDTVHPEHGEITSLAMPAPDEVLTIGTGRQLCRWQLIDGHCRLIAYAEEVPPIEQLFALPGWRITGGWAPGEGELVLFDSSTLAPVPPPRFVTDRLFTVQAMTASSDGRYLFHSGYGHTLSEPLGRLRSSFVTTVHDLHHPTAWPHRPVASLTERDLAALETFEAPSPELHALLDLMRTMAAHRSDHAGDDRG